MLYLSVTVAKARKDGGRKKGGRGRKKRNNQFVVKLHIIKVRFTLNTIKCIFLIFSYFNAIRFNRKEKIIIE